MSHYFRVYKKLLQLNFARLLAYRANFYMSVAITLFWGAFSLVMVYLITYRTTTFFGWTRDELILLTLGFNMFVGIFHTFFSRNFERFSLNINYGYLDTMLLKPLDEQFLISLQLINYANFVRAVLSGILFYYYLTVIMHIQLTLTALFLFFLVLGVGVILMYSVWFITSTLMIWSPQLSNLIDVLYSVNGLIRYPKEMILGSPYYFFLIFIPVTLVVAVPLKILLGKPLGWDLIALNVTAAVLFLFSRWFWQFALKSYTSASN